MSEIYLCPAFLKGQNILRNHPLNTSHAFSLCPDSKANPRLSFRMGNLNVFSLQHRSLKIIFKCGKLQFKSRCFQYPANNKFYVHLLLKEGKSCLNL